jgi:hypothetical protein
LRQPHDGIPIRSSKSGPCADAAQVSSIPCADSAIAAMTGPDLSRGGGFGDPEMKSDLVEERHEEAAKAIKADRHAKRALEAAREERRACPGTSVSSAVLEPARGS